MLNLYDLIASCNGEMRIQPGRYELGWYCLAVFQEITCVLPRGKTDCEFWEHWDGLTSCDNDFRAARNYFKELRDSGLADFVLVRQETPELALNAAIAHGREWHEAARIAFEKSQDRIST